MIIDEMISDIPWPKFRQQLDAGAVLNMVEDDNYYYLKAIKGPFVFGCLLSKNVPADAFQQDFEQNYK